MVPIVLESFRKDAMPFCTAILSSTAVATSSRAFTSSSVADESNYDGEHSTADDDSDPCFPSKRIKIKYSSVIRETIQRWRRWNENQRERITKRRVEGIEQAKTTQEEIQTRQRPKTSEGEATSQGQRFKTCAQSQWDEEKAQLLVNWWSQRRTRRLDLPLECKEGEHQRIHGWRLIRIKQEGRPIDVIGLGYWGSTCVFIAS